MNYLFSEGGSLHWGAQKDFVNWPAYDKDEDHQYHARGMKQVGMSFL